jgi:hypothetical protein
MYTFEEEYEITTFESWKIYYNRTQVENNNIFELRTTDFNKFKTNSDAIKFVVKKALKKKNSIHLSILKELNIISPKEIRTNVKNALNEKDYQKLLSIL